VTDPVLGPKDLDNTEDGDEPDGDGELAETEPPL
jgi:hypothetical protein